MPKKHQTPHFDKAIAFSANFFRIKNTSKMYNINISYSAIIFQQSQIFKSPDLFRKEKSTITAKTEEYFY